MIPYNIYNLIYIPDNKVCKFLKYKLLGKLRMALFFTF